MDRRKNESSSKKQILTALVATIPTFTYGIQIGWLSPMGPLLKSASTPAQAPLTDSDISWMAAALPLAAITGIPFFSYASDHIGRKICVILVSLLSCISWTIKLTAIMPSALIAARAIAGLAAGGCFVVVPVYVKEISEDTLRGALGSLNMTVCKLGVIFVYAVGMAVSYRVNQAVYLAVACAHVVVFCFMPESPNYLLKLGQEKKAANTISWLRSLNKNHKVVVEEILKLKEEQRQFEETSRVSLLSVVRDRTTFSALRMTLVLMAMQTLSGCFALMNYAADVFHRAGTQWSPNTLALAVGSLQLAGSFFTTVSIEKFGRKIPLACSSLVVSICMTTLATCFLLGSGVASWLPVVAVCVCILAYGAGLAPVPMVIMAEVFTFQVRARMAGASMAFSFFCSSMTVLFYTPIANQFGAYVVFYTFAAVTLFGVVYTVLWVPETKGKSLDEIQKYWKKTEPVFV
ncbi:facilitated trehalose transporter Tret1-like isoform X1 [Helicoverpa zea]|uniref:facilitated trehalose transporter Tret1-like isoform X1 n=1 Tax=Helicoverpa zea TaxID=7113 RepID=UPI001F55D6CE|nr:facilitated trehalose transporter Tret1-like isoform X1 [Helicoverpa zea]